MRAMNTTDRFAIMHSSTKCKCLFYHLFHFVFFKSERIRRMKGLPREEKKPTHISADDLVDW